MGSMKRRASQMTPAEALREAFARDLIDLETFERFAGYQAEGRPYMLPFEAAAIFRAQLTDEPGGYILYDPSAQP